MTIKFFEIEKEEEAAAGLVPHLRNSSLSQPGLGKVPVGSVTEAVISSAVKLRD